MTKTINPLILQLEKEWEKYLNDWNEAFQKRLKEEIDGENRLMYALSLNEEEIEFLSNLSVTGSYLSSTTYLDNEQAFKIWVTYKNKRVLIEGTYIAGEEDSSDEDERDDFYEITHCTDKLLSLGGHLCSLFDSIKLADQIGELYGTSDHYNDKANEIYANEAIGGTD